MPGTPRVMADVSEGSRTSRGAIIGLERLSDAVRTDNYLKVVWARKVPQEGEKMAEDKRTCPLCGNGTIGKRALTCPECGEVVDCNTGRHLVVWDSAAFAPTFAKGGSAAVDGWKDVLVLALRAAVGNGLLLCVTATEQSGITGGRNAFFAASVEDAVRTAVADFHDGDLSHVVVWPDRVDLLLTRKRERKRSCVSVRRISDEGLTLLSEAGVWVPVMGTCETGVEGADRLVRNFLYYVPRIDALEGTSLDLICRGEVGPSDVEAAAGGLSDPAKLLFVSRSDLARVEAIAALRGEKPKQPGADADDFEALQDRKIRNEVNREIASQAKGVARSAAGWVVGGLIGAVVFCAMGMFVAAFILLVVMMKVANDVHSR